MRRDRPRPRKSRRRSKTPIAAPDEPLFEALRERRKELAQEQGVPPYVIFHDATLTQMAEQRPGSRQEFGQLSGVGETKLERYADTFLALIREHGDAASAGGG